MSFERSLDSICIEKYESEEPLFVFVLIFSFFFWLMLIISIIGFVYTLFIAILLFVSHIGFIAHVRGNAVRIGPDQFPELHTKINEFSNLLRLEKPPEAYVMQAGGSLNAMATKLFRSRIIVLYADLLEACGNNERARDMIVGHEMGHIHAGHLSYLWFLLPGMMIPFLGSAYSRAREYTCDRYGAALCGDKSGALQGLAILSAGAQYGPKINLEAFVAQKRDLNTGMMTLGKWLFTHPSLSERIAMLDPSLEGEKISLLRGRILAIGSILSLFFIPFVIISIFVISISKFMGQSTLPSQMNLLKNAVAEDTANTDITATKEKIKSDFGQLVAVINEIKNQTGDYPSDRDGGLSVAWRIVHGDENEPIDPFDGRSYGYYLTQGGYVIYSSGPDGAENTEDDIFYNFKE